MKVLAIDQGTTATKSLTLDEAGRFESRAAFEHQKILSECRMVQESSELTGLGTARVEQA